MLLTSTIQLLRFHFSFFLLPVYLFALSQTPVIDPYKATLVFIILHLLVYPASNGYNSYMDRDETPIGGIEHPLQPTRQLFYTTLMMDTVAVIASLLITPVFAVGILLYILASRAYSYRGIRLKKYPIPGFLVVIVFQGAITFFLVYHGSSADNTLSIPLLPAIASSLLIGGFYPLTQIYQHEADKNDGIITISYMLGYRGTFIFTAIVYAIAMASLYLYFSEVGAKNNFFILATIMLPVPVYFFYWATRVWKDPLEASFKKTMNMNMLASMCTNIAFLILLTRRFL
jgi:1,4-dihydroxy-2-naphthoate octaprenyltransferase